MTAFSAGLAFIGARSVFAQKNKAPIDDTAPREPGNGRIKPIELDTGARQQIPIQAQQDALLYFTQATFEPYVGDIFQAPNARGQLITMTLIRVEQYKMQPTTRLSTKKTAQPISFSLTFRAEARLPQFTSIHRVSHPALGEFDLFLTPRQADDGTLLYEAVFNHLR